MPLSFRGVAHPPPGKKRGNIADLNRAEISTTNMGKGPGTDVLVEHDHGSRVGKVEASWEGRNGELRVAGTIDDPQAEALVRAGKLRGLSLGTGVIQNMSGDALMRTQDELSICDAPRRGGCFIDTIDGASVRTVACFSEKSNRKCPAANPAFIRPTQDTQ
jgi:hypothetical protein